MVVCCFLFSSVTARADIVLLGDSIVADVREPLFGWGEILPDFVSGFEVQNKAASGASSRSYYSQYWNGIGWPFDEPVRDVVDQGDFVFIQFGHNDIASGIPGKEVTSLDEYKLWLTTLVEEAQALGTLPVFVTPPENWAHRRQGLIGPIIQRQGHADSMKQVAAETNTPVIDLHAYSVAEIASRTEEEAVIDFSAVDPDTGLPLPDKTHTSENGATIWAEFVAGEFPDAAAFHYGNRPGDFNLDGETDLADFLILSDSFNESFEAPHSFFNGDGNLDGEVSLADFFVFRRAFQEAAAVSAASASTASVPEPSSHTLVVLAVLVLTRCLNRKR